MVRLLDWQVTDTYGEVKTIGYGGEAHAATCSTQPESSLDFSTYTPEDRGACPDLMARYPIVVAVDE